MNKQLSREDHKREAMTLLEAARTTGEVDACIERMRDHLKQGNWTLAEIGTSEDILVWLVLKRDFDD